MRQVSATEANREFSAILRQVRSGESVTVTSKGEPVALITPAVPRPAQEEAKAALLDRLRSQASQGLRWRRDELYDEG
jgi:prevent-host-death family protein